MHGNDFVSAPENDAVDENERCKEIRKRMIWFKDIHERALLESKRLRQAYGSEASAESILENLSSDEYCQIQENLLPWSRERSNSGAFRYQLFAVIMHHGTAYSGHYSAYIRDCVGQGKWVAPSTSGSTQQSGEPTSGAEVPKDVCYTLPRPGEVLVKEQSPLDIVLTIVSTSSEIRLPDASGRTRKQGPAICDPMILLPSIEVFLSTYRHTHFI
jgi:hypothetical protein